MFIALKGHSSYNIAIFDLEGHPVATVCFNSNHPTVWVEKWHFGFPIGMILAFFYASSLTCCYIVSLNLIRLVVCEKMSKTDFQDGGCGISDRYVFSSFRSRSCPLATEQVSTQIDQRFGKRC